jgi:RNA recognition motif-containing protein
MSRVYVGNLDSRATERDLEDEFRVYGVLRRLVSFFSFQFFPKTFFFLGGWNILCSLLAFAWHPLRSLIIIADMETTHANTC